jgi:hypothetical protein
LERDLSQTQQALEDSPARIASQQQEHEREAEALRTRIADLERDLSQVRQSLEQAQQSGASQAEQAAAQAEAWNAERRDWEERLHAAQHLAADQLRQFEAERAAFQAQLSAAESSLRELQQQLEQAHAAVTSPPPSDEASQLRAALEEKDAQLAALNQQISELLAETNEFRARLAEENQRREDEWLQERERFAETHRLQALREAELDRIETELTERERCLAAAEQALAAQGPVARGAHDATAGLPLFDEKAPPLADLPETAPTDDYTPTLHLPRREQVNVESVSADPPPSSSAAEVLARIGLAPHWESDEAPPPAEPADGELPYTPTVRVSAIPGQPAPPAPAPHPVHAAPGSEEEGESIEEYIARLLQRVRGEEPGGTSTLSINTTRPAPSATVPASSLHRTVPAAPASLPSSPTVSTPPGGLAAILGGPAKPAAEPHAPIRPEDFVPRSQAPERTDRLAAMRDLANVSARSAIDRYALTRGLTTLATKAAMSIGAAVSTGILLACAPTYPMIAYPGASVSTIAAGVWFVQAVRCTKQYLKARREKQADPASQDSVANAPQT